MVLEEENFNYISGMFGHNNAWAVKQADKL
jgi:hypothetical protein